MYKLLKNRKGITLIALVITIVVLLILAGVTIATLTEKNGILLYASKSKFITEIKEIEENINLKTMEEKDIEYLRFGALSDLIGVTNMYNEMLYVENGKLVYQSEKVSKNQKKWLEEIGIQEKQGIIPIYTGEQLQEIGSNNVVIVEEVGGIAYNFVKDGYYMVQKDINFECDEEKQWKPISDFQGILDGQNHKISIIDTSTYTSYAYTGGFIKQQNGIVKNLELNLKVNVKNQFGRIMFCKQ